MKKLASCILLSMLSISMFIFAFSIAPIKAQFDPIMINPDGSISPSTAQISNSGNVTYTLTSNINDSIVVERSDIVVDGADYIVQGIGYEWGGPGPPPISIGIYLTNVSGVVLRNMRIDAFYYGVYLGDSSNITVSGDKITNNYDGICLDSSSDCSVSENYVAANNQSGIAIIYSSNNSVSGNNITATVTSGIWINPLSNYNSVCGNEIVGNNYGVWLFSDWNGINENRICRNNIANNNYGIELYYSVRNSLTANNITNNHYGIFFNSSYGNDIYHNNLNNNTQQISYASPNVWDNGYPSGGNYWSDYIERYPNATEIDKSGIWNTPYVIDGGGAGSDRYPFVEPYSLKHDIALTQFSPSKTIVGQGYGLAISVMIANQGDYAETFNATAYANATEIQRQTLRFAASQSSASITFTWNTTNLAYGCYAISANVTLAPGEINEWTGPFTNGTVKVTVPGDINGDGVVNARDLSILAQNWLETVPPGFANADIGGYGIVNAKDLKILAQNWLEST